MRRKRHGNSVEKRDGGACAREPIHRPDAIQPHGCLLALDARTFEVRHASVNCRQQLGAEAASLLGKPVAATLGEAMEGRISQALERFRAGGAAPASFPVPADADRGALGGYVHSAGDRVIVEFEPENPEPPALADAIHAFEQVSEQRGLISKLELATRLTRSYSGYDRVMIYRFDRDWSGEVIAESVAPGCESLLGFCYPASDIPAQARRLFLDNRVRFIADTAYTPVALLATDGEDPLDLSRSVHRSVAPVHREYLRNMGVGATLVCSLIVDGRLWGLITCHHTAPLVPSRYLRELATLICHDVSTQVAFALHNRLRQLTERLRQCREELIGEIHDGQSLEAIVRDGEGSGILDVVGAHGVAVISGGQVICRGVTPDVPAAERLFATIREDLAARGGDLYHSDCVGQDYPWADDVRTQASGVVVALLPMGSCRGLIWFRGERPRTLTWGGNPNEPMTVHDGGTIGPRTSFSAWTEHMRGQSLPWSEEELASAAELQRRMTRELTRLADRQLQLLQQSVVHVRDAVVITEAEGIDAPGPRILFVNRSFENLTGYSAEEVTGKSPRILQGPETDREALRRVRRALENWREVRCELVNYTRTGRPYRVELHITPVADRNGWLTHWLCIQRDASTQEDVEASLRRSERQYRQLVSQLSEGVVVVAADGIIRSVNESAAAMLGIELADGSASAGNAVAMMPLHHADGRPVKPDEHPAVYEAPRRAACVKREYRLQLGDGPPRWISVNSKVIDAPDGAAAEPAILLSFRDITEQYSLRRTLSRLATTDHLTHLPNRSHFRESLASALRRAERIQACVDVILIDLDNFKDVNDIFGHGAGDELLRTIADRLRGALEEGDMLGRLGGDEFAAFSAPRAGAETLRPLAERLQACMTDSIRIEGTELNVVGSAGVASFPLHGDSPEELLRKADIAMYAAKREKSAAARCYSDELELSVQNHMAGRTRLKRALELDQMELHYQPKVGVADGRVHGLEALIRWRDDEDFLIPPDEFIPLAEATGMIQPIGEWILGRALEDLRLLEGHGLDALTIAINLSGLQFKQAELARDLSQRLARASVPAHRLEIEITESVLMRDDRVTVRNLRELSELGIRVFIDDFGTGYSSLAYLRRFVVSALKIDRGFIQAGARDDDQRRLVKTIVNMAHGLGLGTVAEGVETPAELDMLREIGCDAYQGHLFSPAVPLQGFLRQMRRETPRLQGDKQ